MNAILSKTNEESTFSGLKIVVVVERQVRVAMFGIVYSQILW